MDLPQGGLNFLKITTTSKWTLFNCVHKMKEFYTSMKNKFFVFWFIVDLNARSGRLLLLVLLTSCNSEQHQTVSGKEDKE